MPNIVLADISRTLVIKHAGDLTHPRRNATRRGKHWFQWLHKKIRFELQKSEGKLGYTVHMGNL